jgi:hypothetical protein
LLNPTKAVPILINVFASILPFDMAFMALYAAINGAIPGTIDSIGINGVVKEWKASIVAWTKLPGVPGVHEYKLVGSDIGATFPFASAVKLRVSVPPRVGLPETKDHVPFACG